MPRLSAVLALACALLGSAACAGEAPADAKAVLAGCSPWRWRLTLRRPQVDPEALKAAGKDASAPAYLKPKVAWSDAVDTDTLEAPPLPGEWTGPDFDDADWPRTQLPLSDQLPLTTGVLALRGRFVVGEPKEVKGLWLALGYRGGAVVYLNGKEVARFDLPDGTVSAATPAKSYPDEAWLDSAGKALPPPVDQKAEHKERVAKRERRAGPVALPVEALRKGVNVLAVELHRSDFHPCALTWWATQEYAYGRYRGWTPIGLNELRLSAAGGGFAPSLDRPAGLQVWNLDVLDRLESVDFGDAGELRPVRIVGAPNGVFSGALAVSGAEAIKGLRVEVSELAQKGGPGRIPAAQTVVRYVGKGKVPYVAEGAYGPRWSLDPLTDKPPAEVAPEKRRGNPAARTAAGLAPEPAPAALLPVWVTVSVPREAAAGDYEGKVTVSADGLKPAEVALRLSVADWTVPEPRDFRTIVNIYQSPPTLAIQYKVPEWSEEHWKLIDKSFELLAPFGNDIVNIPVVDRTQFGNDEGMVHWLKKPDGSYDYDFTVLDRYLKLVKKHLGVPTFVALQLWHSGGWDTRKADQENTVTVIDPQSKARSHLQVPVFGTEESRKFWTAALAAIKERLAKEGMEKSMCVGILSDGTAPPEVFKMFNEIIPGIGWTRGCHSSTLSPKPYALPGGGVVVCHEFCYGTGLEDPAKLIPKIWEATGPGIYYPRGGGNDGEPLYRMRLLTERSLYRKTRGPGRICLDFWPLAQTSGGKTRFENLYNRWPHSSCAQREPTMVSLAYPGPEGPLNTIRLQLIREGLQEAEAMIGIADAAAKSADRLGPELTAKGKSLFAERINLCRYSELMWPPDSGGWQERTARLFALAAEVAKKLEQKK